MATTKQINLVVASATVCLTAHAQEGQKAGDFLRGECFSDHVWQFKPAGPGDVGQCRDVCQELGSPGFMVPTGPDGDPEWGCRCCEGEPIDLTLSAAGLNANFAGMPVRRSAGEKDHWHVYNTDPNVPLVGQDYGYEARVQNSHCSSFNTDFGQDGLGQRYDLQDCATDVGLIFENSPGASQDGDFTTFMWSEELKRCRLCGPGRAGSDGGQGHHTWTTYTLTINGQAMADPVVNYAYQDSLRRGPCFQTVGGENLNKYDNLQDCVNMATARGCQFLTWRDGGRCRCCSSLDGDIGGQGPIQYNLPGSPCGGGADCELKPPIVTCPAGQELNSATNTCGVCSNDNGQVASWSSGCTIGSCQSGYENVANQCQACTNAAQVASWSSGCTIGSCAPGFWVMNDACVATPEPGPGPQAILETAAPVAVSGPGPGPSPTLAPPLSTPSPTLAPPLSTPAPSSAVSWVSDWPYQGICGTTADPAWQFKYFVIRQGSETWDTAAENCALDPIPRSIKRIIGRGPRVLGRGGRGAPSSRNAPRRQTSRNGRGQRFLRGRRVLRHTGTGSTAGWSPSQSLAQPGSSEEVSAAYTSAQSKTSATLWLGIRFHDGQWVEGSTRSPSTIPGLPTGGQDGDCLAVTFDDNGQPTYTRQSCDTKLFYMCEGCDTSARMGRTGRFRNPRSITRTRLTRSRPSRVVHRSRSLRTRGTRQRKLDNQALSADATTSTASTQCRVGALSCVAFYALLAAVALGLVAGTLGLMLFIPRQRHAAQVAPGMGAGTEAPKQIN